MANACAWSNLIIVRHMHLWGSVPGLVTTTMHGGLEADRWLAIRVSGRIKIKAGNAMNYNLKSGWCSFSRLARAHTIATLFTVCCGRNAGAGEAYQLTPGSAEMINSGLQIYGYVTNHLNGTPGQP